MKTLMRINAPKGQRVRYLDENGFETDRLSARKYLEKGSVYTVEKTIIGTWQSVVYLEEFPDVSFNTVMFEEVEPEMEVKETIQEMFNRRYEKNENAVSA